MKNGQIAYILKNFPKLSETFIASEIYRLENLGADLNLFVIKKPSENLKHKMIEKIKAKPFYLHETTSLTDSTLRGWLKLHFKDFSKSFFAVMKKRPFGFLKAASKAIGQTFRSRHSLFSYKKTYLKEFLQACGIAEQILQTPEIKHLHAHFAHGATTVAWFVSMMMGLKFSFTGHAKDIYLESLNPAGFLKRKMDAAEFVVTCTKSNQKYLEGISTTKVHCLYHGLSADFTNLLEAEKEISALRNGKLRALAVGRLVQKKGLDVFVEACSILQERNIDFEAVIIGEKGDASKLVEQKIAENNIGEKVRLLGSLPQSGVFEQLRKSTMFCLPCRILENGDRDGIPNVMMEAMSCGLPVVTTNISGIPEIIENGENGIMVNPEDAVALADAMQEIHTDKIFAQRLSAAAKETVKEKFDGDVTANYLANLFYKIIEQGEEKLPANSTNYTNSKKQNIRVYSR